MTPVRLIFYFGCRTEPVVPVEPLGRGLRLGRVGDALRPDGAVRPHVHLAHRPDDAAPDDLDRLAQTVVRRALVAHLRDDAVLGRRLGQPSRFKSHLFGAGHDQCFRKQRLVWL